MGVVSPPRSGRPWRARTVTDPDHDVTLQLRAPVPDVLTQGSLRSLASYVLRQEGITAAWTLTFLFAMDREIQVLHNDFMGLDSPTDILTFPYHDAGPAAFDPAAGEEAGGDIVISVEQASAQAVDAGWSTLDELWFLAIHGVLHLAGWDDHDASQRAAMMERQVALLNGWKAEESVMVDETTRTHSERSR